MKRGAKTKESRRIWIRATGWYKLTLLATAFCSLAYLANYFVAEIEPGNIWGLSFGTAAAVFMVGASLYGVRRRMMKLVTKFRLGSGKAWLNFHVYGGALCLLLVFMHTGFRLPSGMFNWILWLSTIWVVISGILGIALQKWIPNTLSSGLDVEVLYERIPELVDELRRKAEKLSRGASIPIQKFYAKHLALTMSGVQPRMVYCIDISGGYQIRRRRFDYIREALSEEDSEDLTELESIYQTKLALDAHFTLQRVLRLWLYAHVPLSVALMILLALHLFAVYYY